MKKIRRMLSALVLASMLMNVPVTVFAESAGEAPAAVGQQAEARSRMRMKGVCAGNVKEPVLSSVWLNLYRRMSGNVPWYSEVF